MVFYALLACLDPPQCCLKVQANLLFSAKITENKPFLMKKADSLELWGNIAEGLDMLEEHKRPFLETSECCAFIQKSFKALRAVFLIFFHDWKLAYNSAIKCLCLDFCAPLYNRCQKCQKVKISYDPPSDHCALQIKKKLKKSIKS